MNLNVEISASDELAEMLGEEYSKKFIEAFFGSPT